MREIDNAIKTTFDLAPDCFLNLLCGSERTVVLQELVDPQVNLPELRGDKAMMVRDGEQTYCILFEAMLKPDVSELPTYVLKASGIQYIKKAPTLVVIVYLTKGDYATFPFRYEVRLGNLRNEFIFERILLWEYEDRILSGELRELAPFLPLFHKNPDPKIMETQKRLLSEIPDPKLRADLTSVALVVNVRVFGVQLVVTEFASEVHMLKESSMVEDWLIESKREGREEGKQEGMQEGSALILQNLLVGRFGRLSQEAIESLRKLSIDQLSALSRVLLTLNNEEDLRAWLGNGAARS